MDSAMEKWMHKAEVLIEALPYIQRFNRKIIVVKYGGSAMVGMWILLGLAGSMENEVKNER